jgi:sugar transferase (PEP-CTERM/EpsH1 system associated)
VKDLLFLSHRIPFPPTKGDKIRSYHFLSHLASRFNIHLGCFFDDPADSSHIDRLKEFSVNVCCLPIGRAQKATRLLRALADGRSMSESCFHDRRMHGWVQHTLARHDIGHAYLYCSAMYPYVERYLGTMRIVVDMVDVDSEKWKAYAASAARPLNMVYLAEHRRVFALERRGFAGADYTLFVSQAEVECFRRLVSETAGRLVAVENGVDFARLSPEHVFPSPFARDSAAIVFTGAMDYKPNIDAVVWFAREVFPSVRRKHLRAEFWVVGANPSAAVRRLSAQLGVSVTGRVPDIRPYLSNAACAVAPLHIARGVQNKVLEAMAMGKPVVATPAALEGLNVVCGHEALMARNVGEFISLVSEVLSGNHSQIGLAARARVEADYQWERNLSVLDRLFAEVGTPLKAHDTAERTGV